MTTKITLDYEHELEIKTEGQNTAIYLDGRELKGVLSATLSIKGGEKPRLKLEFCPIRIDLEAVDGEVHLAGYTKGEVFKK